MLPRITAAFLLLMTATSLSWPQVTIPIPDEGWSLWLDREAEWERDSLYLPDEVDLSNLPGHPPTGGWGRLDPDSGIPVILPTTVEEHYWGASGSRRYRDEYFFETQDSVMENGNYIGVSWWWRDVDVPRAFDSKRAILFIRGARLRAEVYWNRKLVGYNIITETSFTCDVSRAIRPGETNQLAIRITNPGGRLDWLDTQLMTWGTTYQRFHKSHGFGGLDRGMKLTAHDPVYFTDLWVLNMPNPRRITVHAKVMNTTNRAPGTTILFRVLDPDRPDEVCALIEKKVRSAAGIESHVQAELECRDAQLWSEETPKLYRIRATVVAPDTSGFGRKKPEWNDMREVAFGFRWFEADGVGKNAVLRLNGNRSRLISAISWGFWGKNGLWPTAELAEREVQVAKMLGLNCVQFHRNVGKAEVLEVHDRLGVLRYMEPGGGQTALGETFGLYAASPTAPIDNSGKGGDPLTFAEKYMEEKIVRMIRDHRSHPSLVIYCIQNEIHPDLRNPRVFRVLRRMHDEDPSRIVMLKSGFPSGSPSVNQVWMQPYSNVVHYDKGDGYSGWWDDHTVGGPGVWRDELYKGPDDFTHRSTNDREIVMWGEMLGAAVPDNHAAIVKELKAHGGKSYDLKDHEEILAAYNRFLDRWGFRTAFPTADALFVSIGNKSYDFWGRVVETARLAEANDYFVISGWESTAIENHSGLVDNLRGFKGDPTLISKRLSSLRPVIKARSLVVATGKPAILDFFVLNETHKPHGRKLHVWLENPSAGRIEIGTYEIPRHDRDQFVYPVAANVATPPLVSEEKVMVYGEIVGQEQTRSEEELLVIDPAGTGQLPDRIGVITSHPALLKPFELFPGVNVEPYDPQKEYDVVMAANRFMRPYETQTEPNVEIQGTEDDELYRSINYGDATTLEFILPALPKGDVKVTLKFAELFQNAEGMRVFDVALNGKVVLKDFDVFKAAGGKNIAYDRTFTVPAPDGILHITFPRVPKPSARICAIKVEAGDTVIAINCGGKPYRDKTGLVWGRYEPPVQLDDHVLERVREGVPLLVLSEGEAATEQYAVRLSEAGAFRYQGIVGEARASWMGSWYFVRKHPVFDGLPVDCAMGSYYQVPVTNSTGVLLEGNDVEVFVGYSRDHDRNVGAGSFSATLGKGKILFHCVQGVVSGLRGESVGMQPKLLMRMIANSLRYLQAH